MAGSTTINNTWFGGSTTDAEIHLRVHEEIGGRSSPADLAAIIGHWHSEGAGIAAICPRGKSKLVQAVGLGWRDERFAASAATDLVAATAAVGRLWASNHPRNGVVITDLMSLATGSAGGHDDKIAADWIAAVNEGDITRLFQLTGLDLAVYLGVEDLAPAPTAVVVASSPRRHDHIVPAISDVMGTSHLAQRCATIVRLAVDWSGVSGFVDGDLVAMKDRRGRIHGTLRVTRPLEPAGPWLPAS